ncbi:hypothetical protein [Natranaeroarchaeum aerophilus]|uniref:DUF3368 domain-containing protein n=1 Tax=Natranaeroarchaeum aerophilus TaxID=2917711 RepID=A0AAE3FSW9_9EURY|nr:hypothetical protein [Natranaeroarchaeum aerophilus]MCL9814323.1 hypothetical protein [Natranaeroarchaeum aerophilus]
MIVADTSALVTIASIDLLDVFLSEFEVHTTETVIQELGNTAEYDDVHGEAARTVIENRSSIERHPTDCSTVQSSRIDEGEATTARLANDLSADFLITDDLRALPELQSVVDGQVAISPIVLKALVQRDVLPRETALEKLDRAAETRDWLESPIYRRARTLFD